MTNRIGTCGTCGGPITDETPSIQRHCRLCGTVATPPEPPPSTRIEDSGLSRIGDSCLRFQTWSLRD